MDSEHGPWSQSLEITTTSQYYMLLHELSVCLCVGVLQDNLRLQSICTGQSIEEMLNSHNQSLRLSKQSFKPNTTSYCCSFSSLSLSPSPQYVNTPDIYGLSPLMNACRLGNARFFLYSRMSWTTSQGVCHVLCSIAELLLDLGADTEYCNKAGKTR